MNPLTKQETAVLDAFYSGCETVEDVADKLILSTRTIRTHLQNARHKTHNRTTIGLLTLAIRSGWLAQNPNGE